MNAVAVAHGFAQAAREHRDAQDAHAAGCAQARETLSRFWEGIGAVGTLFAAPLLSSKPLLGMMS
jgi:NTE family protein